MRSPLPVVIRCSMTQGKLTILVGPWRASGNWWDANGWQREDWDVQTRDGKVLRLVQRQEEWFVEEMLD